jgi:very-short-patch-repair endonuclease
MATRSNPHALLTLHLKAMRLPTPVHEYRFHDKRRWRFDLCWPEEMVAVEIDGGTWTNGRHTRGSGYERDCEKLNSAAEMGWIVLRFTTGMVESGKAVEQIKRVLTIEPPGRKP